MAVLYTFIFKPNEICELKTCRSSTILAVARAIRLLTSCFSSLAPGTETLIHNYQ